MYNPVNSDAPDTNSALYKFYRDLVKYNRVTGREIPPSTAYYISTAIQEKTGEYYSAEHVWISLWFEALVSPDELDDIPEWYVEKFLGGVKPDIRELKKKLWIKYKKYLLEEFGIDLPF